MSLLNFRSFIWGILFLIFSFSAQGQFLETFGPNALEDWNTNFPEASISDFSFEGGYSLELQSNPANSLAHTYYENEDFSYGTYSMWFHCEGFFTDAVLRWMYQDEEN